MLYRLFNLFRPVYQKGAVEFAFYNNSPSMTLPGITLCGHLTPRRVYSPNRRAVLADLQSMPFPDNAERFLIKGLFTEKMLMFFRMNTIIRNENGLVSLYIAPYQCPYVDENGLAVPYPRPYVDENDIPLLHLAPFPLNTYDAIIRATLNQGGIDSLLEKRGVPHNIEDLNVPLVDLLRYCSSLPNIQPNVRQSIRS